MLDERNHRNVRYTEPGAVRPEHPSLKAIRESVELYFLQCKLANNVPTQDELLKKLDELSRVEFGQDTTGNINLKALQIAALKEWMRLRDENMGGHSGEAQSDPLIDTLDALSSVLPGVNGVAFMQWYTELQRKAAGDETTGTGFDWQITPDYRIRLSAPTLIKDGHGRLVWEQTAAKQIAEHVVTELKRILMEAATEPDLVKFNTLHSVLLSSVFPMCGFSGSTASQITVPAMEYLVKKDIQAIKSSS